MFVKSNKLKKVENHEVLEKHEMKTLKEEENNPRIEK